MRTLSKVLAAGATAIILAATATAANADPVNITVTPGSLTASIDPLTTFETPINVTGVTVLTQPMTLTIQDNTGSQAGWTVSQQVSDITSNTVSSISPNAFWVDGMQSMTQELEPNETASPSTMPAYTAQTSGGDLGLGQAVVTAAPWQGAGKYVVVADLKVAIPRNTDAGNYSGTLTTSITSGSV